MSSYIATYMDVNFFAVTKYLILKLLYRYTCLGALATYYVDYSYGCCSYSYVP